MLSPINQQVHENVEFGSLGSYDEQCKFVDRAPIIQAHPKFPDPGNNTMNARKNVGENGGNPDSSEIDSGFKVLNCGRCYAIGIFMLRIWGVHFVRTVMVYKTNMSVSPCNRMATYVMNEHCNITVFDAIVVIPPQLW